MTNDDEENLALRTISVGDFESLFVAEEDPEALEAKRQAEIADDFFTNGNLFYWTTLSIILVGAVVQGEFYERRFGGGPSTLTCDWQFHKEFDEDCSHSLCFLPLAGQLMTVNHGAMHWFWNAHTLGYVRCLPNHCTSTGNPEHQDLV